MNKIFLQKGYDQEVSIEVQEWELRTSGNVVQTGIATLSDFDIIKCYLIYDKGTEVIASYTNESTTPTGWHALTIDNNRINFTIYSEDTALAKAVDLFYRLEFITEDARDDGADLKQGTKREYVLTLIEE
jgi:hypothetical protein